MRFKTLTITGVVLGGVFASLPASATSYTRDVEVKFNFNSSMSVVVDTADIEILDLAPGTGADSNIVGISISTNNIVGYTASATVGSVDNATTNMTHTNGTNTFASIATDADLSSLTTDNTWGYSTSTDNGTSWANFSGLPLYTDTAKQIATTTGPSNDAIKFKINAKASTAQPAGDYTNKINFIVVANVPPRTIGDVLDENPNTPRDPVTGLPTIQSVNEDVCNATEAIGESTILTDVRDHKNYRVAKLKDERCWFQENLALDLTDSNVLANLSADNTNASNTSLNYLKNGGGTVQDKYAMSTPTKFVDNQGFEEATACSTPLLYTDKKDDTDLDYWQLEEIDELKNIRFGIYYNGCAASAGSYCYRGEQGYGTSFDKPGTAIDMEEDICPAGWRLPTGFAKTSDTPDGAEFVTLRTATGGPHTDYRIALLSPRAGFYHMDGYTMGLDSNAYYLTSTRRDDYRMYLVYIGPYNQNGSFNPTYYDPRSYGWSVRCIQKRDPRFNIIFNSNLGGSTTYLAYQELKYGETDKLIDNTFTHSGYVFNGWNTKADGTGAGYGDQDNYTATADTSITSITLYAQWISESSQNSGNAGKTLQDAYEMAYVTNPGAFPDGGGTKHGLYVPDKDPTTGNYTGTYHEATSAADYEGIPANDLRFAIQDIDMEINGVKVCDYATVIGSGAYVLDLRDYKSYWITKLSDGKCWMTQNLDLDLETTPSSVAKLTSLNTDLNVYDSNGYDSSNGYSMNENNVIIWEPERSTTSTISTSGVISNWANDRDNPYSVDPGDWYWTDTWYGSTINNFLDTAHDGAGGKFSQTSYTDSGAHNHVGNYYNWAAAIASNNANGYTSGYAQNSICPKGWKLPERNELYYGTGYSDSDIATAPAYLVRGGAVLSNTLQNSGQRGYYWSSTLFSAGKGYFLWHSSGEKGPTYSENYLGLSVRCVAR